MQPKLTTLLVMRLDQMLRVHPDQDNSRVCSRCGERVGIYPSGQAVLKRHPQLEIVCNVCGENDAGLQIPAPGALEEPKQSKWRDE